MRWWARDGSLTNLRQKLRNSKTLFELLWAMAPSMTKITPQLLQSLENFEAYNTTFLVWGFLSLKIGMQRFVECILESPRLSGEKKESAWRAIVEEPTVGRQINKDLEKKCRVSMKDRLLPPLVLSKDAGVRAGSDVFAKMRWPSSAIGYAKWKIFRNIQSQLSFLVRDLWNNICIQRILKIVSNKLYQRLQYEHLNKYEQVARDNGQLFNWFSFFSQFRRFILQSGRVSSTIGTDVPKFKPSHNSKTEQAN